MLESQPWIWRVTLAMRHRLDAAVRYPLKTIVGRAIVRDLKEQQ